MPKTKNNRISINDFEKLYDFEHPSDTIINMSINEGETIPIQIKYNVPIEGAAKFVNEIVSECFDEGGTYLPEYLDYMIRRCVLVHYGNLTMPKDHKKAYEMIYGTTVYDEIIGRINHSQYEALVKSVTNKIEYLKQRSLSTEHATLSNISSRMDELSIRIESMFDGVNIKPFAESVVHLVDQINDLPKEQVVSAIVDTIKPTDNINENKGTQG